MKFKTLLLENIRSYENGHIEFEDGENLLFGLNGAGKSTILQGVFGGLFQTKMKYQVGNDFDLPDLVRTQADEGRIELVFEAGGAEYTVEWVIQKSYDDDGEVNGAKTKQGYPTLSSDALPEDVSSLGDVQTEIQRIVGMDAESFVNSFYVQQGDITRLIHASTEDRRKILDGLLGLNRLDEYVDRMEDARREYKKAKRDSKSHLDEIKKRLQDLPSEEEIQSKINQTDKKISGIKGDMDELESEGECPVCGATDDAHDINSGAVAAEHEADLESAEGRLTELDEAQETHDDLREATRTAKSARNNLEDARGEVEQADSDIEDAVAQVDEIESTLEGLRGELEEHRSEKERLNDEIDDANDDLEDAEARVDRVETVEELLSEAVELHGRISELESDIDQHKENRERIGELRRTAYDRMSDLKEDVEELEAELGELDAESIKDDINEKPIEPIYTKSVTSV